MLAAAGWLARVAGGLAALATFLTLLLIGAAVLARYVLGMPQPWMEKVGGWLVVALACLSAAEVQRRGEHIGVDIFTERLSGPWKRATDLVGLLSVGAVAAVLVAAGWETIEFSLLVGMMTEVAGIPLWWVQLALPVGAVLLLLMAAAQLAAALRGRPHLPPGEGRH
ncbi:MAG: TRAP transporter small permease [Acetobacteraceae bacterium]|nr:TRAP transporter small permease [Acetobacteraceae bacterium]MCX7684252.1 TRAP transporter small permease [Acetobacteraceae bacterium]MDW8398526.1 TRAP transporter small permease [Acetobacteraceae bacterium]